MACAPCAAASAAADLNRDLRGSSAIQDQKIYSGLEPCVFTKQILENWKAALKCIKAKNKNNLIYLTIPEINRWSGIIQSSLNYPDNYCYLQTDLTEFQSVVLPLILANVSECIN